MQITSSARTDVGQVRFTNEDSFYRDDEYCIFAVADGVGGSRGGDTASRLFCDVLRERREDFHGALSKASEGSDQRQKVLSLLEGTFQEASERIYRLSEKQPELRGMATTGVILVIGPSGAALGHVGDSRAYLVRSQDIRPLTVDHTLAQEMLAQGLIEVSELESFPHKNVLARAVGQLPTVRVDTTWLDVSGGDSFLLCTDGLYGKLTTEELQEYVDQEDLQTAVTIANDRGGEDNITGVVVRIGQDESPRRALDTQSKILCIQSMFLFRYLNYQELLRILKIVYEEHYERGKPIFKEGEVGDALYMVFAGTVDVRKGSYHLTTIGPGGHFGELAFMDGHPRSATVVATEPTTVLTVRRDEFRDLTRTDPAVASKLLWCFVLNLSGRLRDLSANYVRARET